MLEFVTNESGWDVFMLEYKTERPLDVVLSANPMEKYMRMFRVLWKLKRLEYNLDRAWKVVILGVNRALKDLHCELLFPPFFWVFV
jgi:gamma-tubulin complex component 3